MGVHMTYNNGTPPPGVPLTATWPDPLPDAEINMPYEFYLTATGGVPPYTYGLSVVPTVRQWGQFQEPGHAGANSPWTVTLSGVLAGSTIYVVGMWPNAFSTYPNMTVSDGTNTYTLLNRLDDLNSLSNGVQGTQSMGHWYAVNVPAGNYTVGMSPSPITTEDFVGTLVMELANSDGSPVQLLTNNIHNQLGVAPGTGNLNCALSSLASNGLVVATTFDEVDFAPPTTPTVHGGYLGIGPLWSFIFGANTNYSAEAEYAAVGYGAQTPTFNAVEAATGGQKPNYITTAAAFYGGLPLGLSLNSVTGLISGTPTIQASMTGLSFYVTDSSP